MTDQGATERSAEEPELVSGSDKDGLVVVTVTADYALVVGVGLDPDWRRVIPTSDLAGTVLLAFYSAQAAAIGRQQEILDATPAAPPPADDGGPLPPAAPTYVENLVVTVLDQLDAYARRAARVRAARFEADSPKFAVTVATTGGYVDSVTIDPDWARRAPADDLAREIHAAFAAVQARTAELAAEVGGPTGEMAELTELVTDPARLLGLIGMRGGKADS